MKRGWVSLLANLFTVYEDKTGMTSSPVCILCTNRAQLSLRVRSVSCVRTEHVCHFWPVCVLCTNSAEVSLRDRSVSCVQTQDVYHNQPCLFVAYENMMDVTFNRFCTTETEVLIASSACHLHTLVVAVLRVC